MRRTLVPFLSSFALFAACGDDTTAVADLSMPDFAVPPDMTVLPDMTSLPDLTPTPDLVHIVDWSCVGKVSYPAPAKTMYTFPVHAYDYFNKTTDLAGATIKVCALTDAACATPTFTATTDSKGLATITAPSAKTGLNAYIDIKAVGTGTTTYPEVLMYPNSPAPDQSFDGSHTIGLPIFSTSTFNLVTGILQVTADPAKGSVAFAANDCGYFGAPGVTTASTAGGTTYYVAGGLPSKSATATDYEGAGFIVNVPAGTTTVKSTESATVFSSHDVTIRAGAITSLSAIPTM